MKLGVGTTRKEPWKLGVPQGAGGAIRGKHNETVPEGAQVPDRRSFLTAPKDRL